MCRLTYTQALDTNVWSWLVENQPSVIWLYRENLLRQAISVHLNIVARRSGSLERPAHTFRDLQPVKIQIDPALFVKYARGLNALNLRVKAELEKFKQVYSLTYAQVVGGESKTAYQLPMKTAKPLCAWLGVRCETMSADLRPVNPYPLWEIISNWKEIETAVSASEFADQLEKESVWSS
jgi:hypothetical protein